MYRTGRFPLEWLQQQSTAPGTSDSVVYGKLQQLLSFFNLPGTVLGWLPLTGVTLKHAKALVFYVRSTVTLAVEGMLSFPLLTGTGSSSSGKIPSVAVFLATTTGKDDAPLQVHAVKLTAPEEAAERVPSVLHNCPKARASSAQLHNYGGLYRCYVDWAKAVAASCSSTSGKAAGADVAPCGAHDSEWELNDWAGSSYDDILEAVVSAEHPVFGVPLYLR
ncbi:hypothetical protein OEZ86_005802 [Tetradesmus obliquus]|nr:hypothetical protein OEZ86_005802 [Tetradesmus obliquus]